MKQILAVLMLVVLSGLAGCADADVQMGGGESVVLEQKDNEYTGAIKVQGHVVNSGSRKAKDVEVRFEFFRSGTLYLEGKLLLGDISEGGYESYSGTFVGPPVDPAAFTWAARIEWD